jgi:hypothetical protein
VLERGLAAERCVEALAGRETWTPLVFVRSDDVQRVGFLADLMHLPGPVEHAEAWRRINLAEDAARERWVELRAGALAGGDAVLEAVGEGVIPSRLRASGLRKCLRAGWRPWWRASRSYRSQALWGR